ncbi:MAG: YnfC family lipoprotein [Yokenella regensburgei]|uniref:UPF0257 lipoprotein C7387_1241 n=1 Tax=Yokenella regensburgei TaxID=158877 RepID=A0AB38FS69_9ENTR|nr:YnfC family lipoprotein [Yokenella regensburgei]KFD20827.1 hypothetical protein GYRE_03831 [Yokenella regensburgei ATCC 49455]MDR3104722.1 YnfC family lipoprotein [Yokenella regensburgei]RKR64543.1 uncharacterized protein UPF0257 [Yokenella regensburgei]SQA60937.1 lipoprotein [Yokenella regensburgei]SQA67023.1 lipoprotein [Yokenella regensburgei]
MKKALIMVSMACVLAGCDNATAPASFTPEMASFSNEFDFDPLRGPVKAFSQTLMDEDGKTSKQVNAKMSEEGCFDLLELKDVEHNTGAALVLDANYYVDATTDEKRIKLQGKCQLAELPAAGLTWETDDNGFVVAAHSKDVQMTYSYAKDGYPLGKTTAAQDEKLAVALTPSKDLRKRMDYTAVSLLNDKKIGDASQQCKYDRHDNPVSCELKMTDDSVKPPVVRNYTIKNTIEYY